MPPTPLAALDAAPRWLNSGPLTAAALRGRVVAVQFCTYSCVNWIRTLPYVRAWADRYRDDGLTVIGAHTPEFAFETEPDGIRRALDAMGVTHPVVPDDDYAIWRAFDNHYWPALYVLDGDGRPRYRHFGEGAYVESEQAIQDLLGVSGPPVDPQPTGVELAADRDTLRTPETYLGAVRADHRDAWALDGAWTTTGEHVTLEKPGGSIAYRFQARDLNLVLTPPPGGATTFTVRLDGQPPGDAHGVDTAPDGTGTLDAPRMYQLIQQPEAPRERTFSITFHAPGVRAYVFTFG